MVSFVGFLSGKEAVAGPTPKWLRSNERIGIVTCVGWLHYAMQQPSMAMTHRFIVHPHTLVQATSERFLLAVATFRVRLASESHWV